MEEKAPLIKVPSVPLNRDKPAEPDDAQPFAASYDPDKTLPPSED